MDIRNELNSLDVEKMIQTHIIPIELRQKGYCFLQDTIVYANDTHSMVDYCIVYYKENSTNIKATTRYRLMDGKCTPLYSQVNRDQDVIMICKHDDEHQDTFFIHARIGGRIEKLTVHSNEWIRPIFTKEQLEIVKATGGFSFPTSSVEKPKELINKNRRK